MACGCVGILIGSVYASGLGIKMGALILSLGNHNLLLTLVITMIVSIILGMGLPTVVVYITLAAMVIPGLVDLGVNETAAHFFCFYFGVIGCITPPVAISAFIGAGLAGGNFMKTGFVAMKIGIASYIIPFLFVHYPQLLMVDGWSWAMVWRFTLACLGIFSLAVFIQGFFMTRLKTWERVIPGLVAIAVFIGGTTLEIGGSALFILALTAATLREKRRGE